MEYQVYDPQTRETKTLHFEAVKVLVNSNSHLQARENWEALWQIEPGGKATIKGYNIKRVK